MNQYRSQKTIQKPIEVTGVGFFTNADITLRFCPAPVSHGISFLRTDLPGSKPIPALLEYAVFRERRTALQRGEAVVELTEHVLASVVGLGIDNCLIEINGPELPGGDGSAKIFVDALLQSKIVDQRIPCKTFTVTHQTEVASENQVATLVAIPHPQNKLKISYTLDYGDNSPIPAQTASFEITKETFIQEIAFARTFVLEEEVAYLQAAGYGKRTTAKDLLVFRADGTVIDNQLHCPDECARHKVLDCLGDFALLGCNFHGSVEAIRSGHQLNRELVKKLQKNLIKRKQKAA